jgi:hypothetical protein
LAQSVFESGRDSGLPQRFYEHPKRIPMLVAAWLFLALVHLTPAAVLVRPDLIRSLYAVEAAGDLGVLLIHRGALFAAVVVVCLYAAWEPSARRAAALVVAISVVSFLLIYASAGAPSGSLRLIALADLVALAPLVLVTWKAWQSQTS